MSAWKSRWSWVRLVKSADLEADRVAAVQRQRVRGDLHRAGPVAALEHPPEGRLQVDRLRRGPLDLLLHPADHLLHRPQQPALDPRRLEDLPDQEGSGRLPVRPGDPRPPSAPQSGRPRTAPPTAPSPPARRRTTTCGTAKLQLPLDDQADRPGLNRRGGELVPIDLLPGHAEEQRPGLDLAAVVGQSSRRSPTASGIADDLGRSQPPATSSSSLTAAILGRDSGRRH